MRGDHNDIGQVIATGIGRAGIGIGSAVACSRHEGDARLTVGSDGRLDHQREVAGFPRVVGGNNIYAEVPPHPGGIVEGGQHTAGVAGPAIVLESKCHQRHSWGDASYADAIVGNRTDRAGDVRAVAIAVERQVVVVDKVPAMDVVNEPVAVIINTVAGDFAGIGPDVPRQVGMVDVDARVDHRHNHFAAPRCQLPGFKSSDIDACRAVILPSVVEGPLVGEEWIVDGGRTEGDVGLDPGNSLLGVRPANYVRSRDAGGMQGKAAVADRVQPPAGLNLHRQIVNGRVPAAHPAILSDR